jgi:hypothetical protein
MSLQPINIYGSSIGLELDKKPFLLPDQAFSALENAYVWRDRVVKKEGLKLLGRLRRILTVLVGNQTDGTATYTNPDVLSSVRATDTNAEIESGSVTITIAPALPAETTIYNDSLGTGVLTRVSGPYTISSGTINYVTGQITLNFTVAPPAFRNVVTNLSYFPNRPVMGIYQRDLSATNAEDTIFFDTRYAYHFVGSGFQEFITGTTWSGTDSDFFWCTNFRGVTPDIRLFFATNFLNDGANPIRYSDGITWTTFQPVIADNPPSAAQSLLYQAKILIPYYGRLLALNTWEGTTAGGAGAAVNFFARCRFSQIGDPTDQVNGWRSDIFGRGGFIDAPTSESIVSAVFYKNTLIVFFERTTWQIRYQGEYGIPFIWERISSDFGSESPFSPVLFDTGILAVGDKAIITSSGVDVQRIDTKIPDIIFSFRNAQNGVDRVTGVRDFQKELVYWNYSDSFIGNKFPNRVLVYNYRNNTFAIFRDNITFFGTYQSFTDTTWDSTTVTWDDMQVTWDDPDSQSLFPSIVAGNQQGFVHIVGQVTQSEPSLSITGVDLTVSPNELTVLNHNLEVGDTIYITGLLYNGVPSEDLNDQIFRVGTVIDADTISIMYWDSTQYVDTPAGAASTYLGNGKITLFPKLNVISKDFNPYSAQGQQLKLSYIDFLTDATPSAVMSVILYVNASPAVVGNLLVGNNEVETYLTSPYYVPSSEYAWHRFFATLAGQFIRVQITYDDSLMNTLETHQQDWTLNAMTLWTRIGGKSVF